MALSDKQQAFVDAYLRTFNATKSAIEAGYSEKTAYSQGSRLLKDAEIKAFLRARYEEHAMDANELLHHLAEIARGDMNDLIDYKGNLDLYQARQLGKTRLLKRVKNRSVTTADKDGEGSDISETEVEAYDRLRALELIGKHLAMFTDKVQMHITFEDKLLADITAGKVTYDDVVYVYDGDESLAAQLFARAGVPVNR